MSGGRLIRCGSDGKIKSRDVQLGTVVGFQRVTEQICTSRKMAVMCVCAVSQMMTAGYRDVRFKRKTIVGGTVHEALARFA